MRSANGLWFEPPYTWAEQEMFEGYRDGIDLDQPEPSLNRSMSYRHGFANGRSDRAGAVRGTANELRKIADECIAADDAAMSFAGS